MAPETYASKKTAVEEELRRIGKMRGDKGPTPPEKVMGLAFSGGGIRSATFNLGILQAFANLRLLGHVDYLSTVSGGGYIGSWLSALFRRECLDPKAPSPESDEEDDRTITRVQRRIDTRSKKIDGRAEDPAVSFLRRYSNYLTPRAGVLSVDSWTLIATYLRNLVLTLSLVILGLSAILLIPHWLAGALESTYQGTGRGFLIAVGAGAFAYAMGRVGFSFASFMRPDPHQSGDPHGADGVHTPKNPGLDQNKVVTGIVVPLLLTALSTVFWLDGFLALTPDGFFLSDVGFHAAVGAGLGLGAWIVARGVAKFTKWRAQQDAGQWWGFLGASLFATVVGVPLYGALAAPLADADLWLRWNWAPPLFLVWFCFVGTLTTGLMGPSITSAEREWMGRLGGWLLIVSVAWAAMVGIVVYGPVLVLGLQGWVGTAALFSWLGATLAGLAASRSPAAKGLPSALQVWVLRLAPYAFALGMALLLATAVGYTRAQVESNDSWETWTTERNEIAERARAFERHAEQNIDAGPPYPYWGNLARAHRELLDADSGRWWLWLVCSLILYVAGIFLSARIGVNRFSMHSFYRNRLVRCYLGASVNVAHRQLHKQPFTGFHSADDFPLAELSKESPEPEDRAPLHLINANLNLIGGDELAWQERKGLSFAFSPVYSGYDTALIPKRLGVQNDKRATDRAYQLTSEVEDTEFAYGDHRALQLGSAMAISGGAASPAMGSLTTPALSALLTVFNLRLGAWLRNTNETDAAVAKTLGKTLESRSWALLFQEMFGLADSRDAYVSVSDGGHFDNLGIYELVRRRCGFIIACDAGADPGLEFKDLGNALRKCRADFNVEIEIDVDPIKRSAGGHSEWHCAIGKVYYPETPDERAREGDFLYIKSSLTGREPKDVLSYSLSQSKFPHQSTADQFFNESQFESYRRLGLHIGTEVFAEACAHATQRDGRDTLTINGLREALRRQWRPKTAANEQHFTRHAASLNALFTERRQTPELAFLDAQIYPAWGDFLSGSRKPGATPDTTLWIPYEPEQRRQGFYFCNSLIQLMESVYLDLDLESQWDHPDNRGWMNLFRHWAWSGMFRASWAIAAPTYGSRFESFCEQRLHLSPGEVHWQPLLHDRNDPLGAPMTAEAVLARAGRPSGPGRPQPFLNFLEREQLAVYFAGAQSAGVEDLYQLLRLEVVVPGPTDAILRFGFGYALIRNGELALFRVQDHLRNSGLGGSAYRRVAAMCRLRSSEHAAETLRRVFERVRPLHQPLAGISDEARERFVREFAQALEHYEALETRR